MSLPTSVGDEKVEEAERLLTIGVFTFFSPHRAGFSPLPRKTGLEISRQLKTFFEKRAECHKETSLAGRDSINCSELGK